MRLLFDCRDRRRVAGSITGAGYGGTRGGGRSGCQGAQRCRGVSGARAKNNYKNHLYDGARRRSRRVHFRSTREPDDGRSRSRIIRRGYRLSGNDTNRLRPRRSRRRARGRNLGRHRQRPCGSTASAGAPATGSCGLPARTAIGRKALRSCPLQAIPPKREQRSRGDGRAEDYVKGNKG